MNIADYLKKINLHKLLAALGITNIKPTVNDIMASCPFHSDNNPSWGINKHSGQWHCFSCGANGNLITLVVKVRNIPTKHAIQYLYQFAGIKTGSIVIEAKTIYRQIKKIIRGNQTMAQGKTKPNIVINLPLNRTDDLYMGLQYFEKRNIDKHTLKQHNITFCTSGFYKNRAIIPIVDHNGVLVTFEARDITGMAEKKVLYPKGSNVSKTIYNLNNIKGKDHIILVEGIMDALYLSARGFNAGSIYGLHISPTQEELLSRYFDNVYLCLDGDKEGRKAMYKQGKKLSTFVNTLLIHLPIGKDPDEILLEHFNILKSNAVEYNQYITNQIFQQNK